ncbi:MAG: ABC transporter permease [Acidobacteriota bacterium]
MIAVSILTFVLAELAPGDFLAEMQLDPRISEETLETLRARYGLDQPLPVRYVRWLDSIVSGDLGHSFAHNMPVGPLLWPRAINTLLLTASAMLLSWLLAVPLGAWAAARRGGWLDRSSLGITAVLMAVPELLLGLGCLMLAVTSGWFPVGGMSSLDSATLGFWHRLGDLLRHLALPSLALTLASLPVLFRHVRSAMIDALATPHIQAARGHGIGLRRLLFHHALPTAAGPLTQLFGLSIASLLSGALLIEVIMSWPGIGPLLIDAILARDLHVVIGTVLLSGLLMILGNLIADALLLASDPRIRR